MRIAPRFFLGLLLGWFGAAVTLRAHDPGISTAQGKLGAGALDLTTGFSPLDAQLFVPPEARTTNRKMTAAEFETVRSGLEAVAPELWAATADGKALTPRGTSVQLLPGDSVSFHVVFALPAGAAKIGLSATKLGLLPPAHREFVVIAGVDGKALVKKLVSAANDTLEIPLGAAPGGAAEAAPHEEPPTFWGFLKLGVEHIWTGYDHMLFLFALLVVCRSFRSIVTIISCFTLAHSLTLALATLNLVSLPSAITEPAIAASIVFVGVENLIRRGAEPRGRWALTFAFGLIHGFGFASVLRDLGVGVGGSAQGVAMPLFTFNLGVEVGQITVASIVLPIVWQLRKNPTFVRLGVPVLSAIVSAAGLYWFLERTIFA